MLFYDMPHYVLAISFLGEIFLHSFKPFFSFSNSNKCKVLLHLAQDNKILQQVLDNIICRSVFDIFKLLDVLHELLNNLNYQVYYHCSYYPRCLTLFPLWYYWLFIHHWAFECNSNGFSTQTGHNLKMLVVDSISSLITPVLGGNGAHGMLFWTIDCVNLFVELTYVDCIKYGD